MHLTKWLLLPDHSSSPVCFTKPLCLSILQLPVSCFKLVLWKFILQSKDSLLWKLLIISTFYSLKHPASTKGIVTSTDGYCIPIWDCQLWKGAMHLPGNLRELIIWGCLINLINMSSADIQGWTQDATQRVVGPSWAMASAQLSHLLR